MDVPHQEKSGGPIFLVAVFTVDHFTVDVFPWTLFLKFMADGQ